jgi:hypothetical protein
MKNFIFLLLFMVLCFPMMAHASPFPGGFSEAYVQGNITGGDKGEPIGGAKIWVIGASKKKPNAGCGMGFALSAGSGNYAVGVGQNNLCVKKKHPINGKYFVEVSKRGYLPQKKLVDFQKLGTNVIDLNFILVKSYSNILVQVTTDAGAPIPYAMVTVTKNPFSLLMKTMNTPSGQYGTKFKPTHKIGPNFAVGLATVFRTDKNGRATIPVSPGDYNVLADKTGYTLTTKNPNPLMQGYANFMMQLPYTNPAVRAQFSQEFNQPQPGAFVHVVQGDDVTANLSLAKNLTANTPTLFVRSSPQVPFVPVEYFLDGHARSSPNNVLFFTPRSIMRQKHRSLWFIVRSRILLGLGKVDPFKAHFKSFDLLFYGTASPAGCIHKPGHISPKYCVNDIYSFTDPTGTPGRSYYYYIFEAPLPSLTGGEKINTFNISGKPYSNAVKIITLK